MKIRHAIAALLFASALARPAAAAEPSEVDQATARALTIEGYEALDRKDYATAADRFRRANALYHVPTVALGLAHAEVGLGKLVSALATYSGIVREGLPPKAPPAFVKAVDDARRELDALAGRVPNVIVTVKGTDLAKVTIDGVEVPSVALGVKRPVDPGNHVVRATAPGFAPRELTVSILEGKTEQVTLELEAEAKAPPPPVVAPPPPPRIVEPPPPPPPPPPPSSAAQRTAGFAVMGAGAAGLAAGAITGGAAIAKHSGLLASCPSGVCSASQEPALQSDVDTFHRLATASTASFVAGAVLVGAGAVVVLTAPKARAAQSGSLSPVLGLGYLGAKGRF